MNKNLVLIPRYIFLILAKQGINLPDMLSRGGIDPRVLLDPSITVSGEQYAWLVDEACALTKDPALSVHISEKVWPEYFGVLGYLIMSCSELGESLTYLAKYKQFVDEGTLETLTLDDNVLLKMQWNVDPMPRFHIEGSFVYLISLFRWLTNTDIVPEEVHFTFAEPAYAAELQRVFKCVISFGQASNVIIFKRDHLSLPVVWKNEAVNAKYVSEAEQQFKKNYHRSNLSEKISEFVYDKMNLETPTADLAASKFNMSVRTLHRNLKKEGTSFKEIVEATRKKIALAYLQHDKLDVKEIAFRLGYSNVSAFYRAFSRWTGQTPVEFRSAHAA